MRLAELTLGWPMDSEVQDWALGLSDEYLLDNNCALKVPHERKVGGGILNSDGG